MLVLWEEGPKGEQVLEEAPIRRKPNPDPGGPNKEISSDRTTPKDRKDPEESKRGQPS